MRASLSLLLALVLGSCSMISCPRQTPPPDVKQMTLAQAHGRLRAESERRVRVAGLYKARLGGVAGLVASADLDVIAETPARLHLAVQSFFGQPVQVLATDGERVTLYDARGEGGPRFFAGPATERSAELLLGVPLTVDEVVAAILGRLPPDVTPLAHAQQSGSKRYTVVYALPRGGRATVTADGDDVIRSLVVGDDAGAERFALTYDDIEDRAGVPWATSVEVRATVGGKQETLTLSARDITVNGAPLGDEVFSVGLPPGESFEPLPTGAQPAPLGATGP
jgi:hypothetical protein